MQEVADALHAYFDEVCRLELHRLERKSAGLECGARLEVAAATAVIVHAIAGRAAVALEGPHGGELAAVVTRLFRLPIA